MTARGLDVLCLGETIVDFFPERAGIGLADATRFDRHLGGAPANVAVGLARLGVRAGLCTLVGRDAFGDFLVGALTAEGVDVRGVGRHPHAKTGVTFVAVAEGGERSFTFYRDGCADQRVGPDDVDPTLVAAARVLHIGSSTLVLDGPRAATHAALAAAADAGAVVSMDPNLRLHLWPDAATARARTLEALARAHVVKLAEDELVPLFGTADPAAAAAVAHALGPPLVVITRGARGAEVHHGGRRDEIPAEAVAVLDTTGAGDGFVAGFLAALLPALPIGPEVGPEGPAERVAGLSADAVTAAAVFGCKVAGRVVTRFGATSALPRRSELV